jgi:hypothetical protein
VGPMGDRGRTPWEDGCGNGRWCLECRQEIREEALLWLRELNLLPGERKADPVAVIYRWSPQLLLADL